LASQEANYTLIFREDKEKRKEKVRTDLLSAQKYLKIQLPKMITTEQYLAYCDLSIRFDKSI
jgi:hypothetical protein